MKTSISHAVIGLIALVGSAAAAAGEQRTPVTSITLSTGGLAEIHRKAAVDASGRLLLEAPLEQVNDILKSLVVLDEKASVRRVSLAGPGPLSETFRDLPFPADDLASMPRLLRELRGTRVRIGGPARHEGVVLGVETVPLANGAQRSLLGLMDDAGVIRRVALGERTSVEVLDGELRSRMSAALDALGSAASETSRRISVLLEGAAGRDIELSYVVAAPVWKTSYRVVLDGKGEARLQAWAILENASGEDWDDVRITLESSAPVTLSQRLHDRYWKERDELPVAIDDVGLPPEDAGTVAAAIPNQGRSSAKAPNAAFVREVADVAAAAPMIQAMSTMARAENASAAEREFSATFVLDGKHDVAHGDTAAIPIIDADVKAEALSFWREDRGSPHPVAAVSLGNDTGTSLPAGILTVYEDGGGYVGDAALSGLPVGETRMASFALDRKVAVTREDHGEQELFEIKASRGLLTTKTLYREKVEFVVDGANDGARTVVIEVPKRDGWSFASESLDAETATAYRLKVGLAAGGSARVAGTFERSGAESYRLADLSLDRIAYWGSAAIDAELKAGLSDLARAKRTEATARRAYDRKRGEYEALAEAQSRTRDNLRAVAEGTPQELEFTDKLSELEREIERNESEQRQLLDALHDAAGEVARIIQAL